MLGIHDDRLNDHSIRIKNMELNQVRTDTIVQNVCRQIGTLVKAIWWFIGIFITTLGGFFIWYIQNLK